MNIKTRFIQFLQAKYTDWNNPESFNLLSTLISDQLLSEKIVELPKSVFADIQTEITVYTKLRNWGTTALKDQYAALGLSIPANEAVCTSYDFHVTVDNEIKLIEINTNAAFLAMGTELYDFHNLDCNFRTADIVNMFKHESQLAGHDQLSSVTIIDEKPTEQRLYIEFLLFQKIFNSNGIDCDIKDASEVIVSAAANNLIYNRYTDFTLSSESSVKIKELFNANQINLSPNPYEYFLLADKQRMLDWQNQTDAEIPKSLLKVYDLGVADREFIWSIRKNLFFKPKSSYGGKQAYKGASISHKTFDEFYGPNMIAQEYVQPPELDIKVLRDGTLVIEKMKCDIRCYAYQGKLQIVMARLYQGQTTNLRTTGGGFTVVNFI
jgi:hypothetical protein